MNKEENGLSSSLLNSGRGFQVIIPRSQEEWEALTEKENAAKMLAAGMLGDCYLLQEILDGYMTSALVEFRKYKWYRQQMKHDFRMSRQQLHKGVMMSSHNSESNEAFMREVADKMGERMKLDIFKMEYGLKLALEKLDVSDADAVAKMLTVDIMLQYINCLYEDIVKACIAVYGSYEFYDSWFGFASCRGPKRWWEQACDAYDAKYIKQKIDLNKIPAVGNGLRIIQKKIQDKELCEELRLEALEEYDPGKGDAEFAKALEVLNLSEKKEVS